MIIGILVFLIVGLLGLFSVQNATTVSVSLLSWRFETTLPILIIIAVLLGVLVQQLIRQWAARRSIRSGN